jgi:hypothetical protein
MTAPCHVRIVSGPEPYDTTVYVNEIEIDGVSRIDFEIDAERGVPIVRLVLLADELEIQCERAQVQWNGPPN